ncbi:MAG TPA: ATP-dependent Clp protease adaptor ClpS [Phycisphaerae bacterium]|jgi:ATP-dependent Clp protease adaptor protein ClpS
MSDPSPQSDDFGDTVIAVLPAKPDREIQRQDKNKREPNYHVIIWNDEEHTYEYVIVLLMKIFGHSEAAAYNITWEVDKKGKGIAYTCHKELAELKCEQILGFGADPLMKESKGPIRATIEPAPE